MTSASAAMILKRRCIPRMCIPDGGRLNNSRDEIARRPDSQRTRKLDSPITSRARTREL